MEFILAIVAGLFATWYIGAAVVVMALWVIIGTAYDRSDNTSAAMWIGVIGAIIVTLAIMGLAPAVAMVTSAAFWQNVLVYLGIGLAYSWAVEFFFAVRKASKNYSALWASHVKDSKELRHYFNNSADATPAMLQSAKDSVDRFVSYNHRSGRLISIATAENGLSIEPRTNRRELVSSISAWTLLWPAYAVSLIIGDLFKQLIELIVDMTSKLSTGFVRWAFRDTFKV